MDGAATIDYEALAKQYGGTTVKKRQAAGNVSAKSPIDYAALAKQFGGTSTPAPAPPPNFSNTKETEGQGLYKMTSPTGEELDVPYSKVLAASKAGYTTTQKVRERYAADLNEEHMAYLRAHLPDREMKFTAGGPSTMGQPLTPATGLPQTTEAATPAEPSWWQTVRQKVSDATAPKEQEKWTNFAKRVGRGLFGMADFPVAASGALIDALSNDPDISAKGMDRLFQMLPPQMVVDRVAEFKKDWKADPNAALNNASADAATFFLAHKAGEMGGKGAGKAAETVTKNAPESFRSSLKRAAGASPTDIRDEVQRVVTANEKIDKANITGAGDYETAKAAATQEQIGRELTYQQEVRTKAEQIQTGEATEAAKQQATHQQAVSKVEEANETARQKVETETSTAQKEYFRKQAEHQQQVQAIEAENERLQAEHHQAVAEQEGLQTRLNEADRGAKVGLTALEKRLHKEASAKYAALVPKLADYEADPKNIEAMVNEALDAEDPAVGKPPLLTKLETLAADKALKYRELDDFRGAIGSILRGSQVAGSTYHIYRDIMEPVIIDEMNRIAKEHNLQPEADEARAFFRSYAESFRDRTSPLRKIVKSPEAHGTLKAMRGKQSYLARLRAFEPDGEKLATQIESGIYDMRQAGAAPTFYGDIKIKALKAPTLSKIPEFKEEPPEPGVPKIAPSPKPPQPELTAGSPEERAAQIVKQPERVPLPPEFVPEPKQTLTLSDIRETQKQKILSTGEERAYSKAANTAGILLHGGVSTWALAEMIRGSWGYGAALAAARILMGLSESGIGKLLQNEKFADWLAKPTEADLAIMRKLTPEEQAVFTDNLTDVLKDAKQKGLGISPQWTKLAGVAGVVGGAEGVAGAAQSKQSDKTVSGPQSKSDGNSVPTDRAVKAQALHTYAQAISQFAKTVSRGGLVAGLAQLLSVPTPSGQAGIPVHVAPRLASQAATVAALARPARTDLATLTTLPKDQRGKVEEAIGLLAKEAKKQGKLTAPSPWLGILNREEVAA